MIFNNAIPAHQKRFVSVCFFGAVLFHIIAAIFSIGYYYADEQYQVIEFSGYKLGTHTTNELAWEFKYQLRSGFLPSVCYFFLSVFKLFGLSNPFHQAIALRLFSAVLSLTAMACLVNTFTQSFKNNISQKAFIFSTFLLWFLPFLDVRFASETFAAALFIISFCMLHQSQFTAKKNFLIIALIASTILMRYQMLLPFLIMAFWYLIYTKDRTVLMLILSGIGFSFLAGLFIDFYFYETWTVPLYNYASMILTGSGPDFGSEPWYFYFIQLSTKSFLPIGLLLIVAFIYYWIQNPKSLITWITLCYFMVHCFLPHKELRFLFPMLFFSPLVIGFLIETLAAGLKEKWALQSFKTTLYVLGIINLMIAVVVVLLPASPGIAIANYLNKNVQNKSVLIHTPYSNPYSPFESIPIKFYSNENIEQVKIDNAALLPDSVLNIKSKQFLCIRNTDYEVNKAYLNQKGFGLIYYAIPPLIIKWNAEIWFTNNDNFVLLER